MKIWSEYKSRGGVNSIKKKVSPYGESLVSHCGLGLWLRKQALLFSEGQRLKPRIKHYKLLSSTIPIWSSC